MQYKKYPSFKNHYKQENIDWWLCQYPELAYEHYVIQEKLHGAHIQLVVAPGKFTYVLCSRNQVIENTEDFHNVREILKQSAYVKLLENLHKMSIVRKEEIGLYGEVIGNSIIPKNPIQYGNTSIRFFDLRFGDTLVPPDIFEYTLYQCVGLQYLNDIVVPCLGVTDCLLFAINYDILQKSYIASANDHIIEGVVIKPYKKVFTSNTGKTFYLKKKNKWALEKKSSIPSEEGVQERSRLKDIQQLFLQYLTQA